MTAIKSQEKLRALIGVPSAHVGLKIHTTLNAAARGFIARSPLLLLATCDGDGMPIISPRGDAPGFVAVLDERTLLIPERKGNKLVFSLQNVLGNPKVGLLFLLPGTCETLRVQGSAELTDEPVLCGQLAARGANALLVLKVSVQSCYFHCAKALLRAQLWEHETWPAPIPISFGAEIAQSGGLAPEQVAEFDAGVRARYKTDL
jgi:uncharacterized protein